jgi:tRNA-2-methylthio-N6-dimethylallyladenosine synthase
VDRIKKILPDCGISADIIAGFCTEDEADHADTLSIMRYSQYDFSYMFMYSERPGTLAARRYQDDVPEETKRRRLQEIVALQNELSLRSNEKEIGKTFKVLIEGDSKKNSTAWKARTSHNKVVVFPKENYPYKKGDFVSVQISECTQGTLLGQIIQPTQP